MFVVNDCLKFVFCAKKVWLSFMFVVIVEYSSLTIGLVLCFVEKGWLRLMRTTGHFMGRGAHGGW